MKDLFFPEHCVHCGAAYGEEGEDALCRACERALEFHTPPRCVRCSLPSRAPTCRACRARSPSYDRLIVLGSYEGVLQSLVKAAKLGNDGAAARRLIRRAAADAPEGPYDSIIAVPSDHSFAGELADSMAVAKSARRIEFLLRDRSSIRQGTLNRAERKRNAPKLFSRREAHPGQSVLLVDDVVTTGATVETCAALMRNAGALRVDALAIARTPRVDKSKR